MAYARMPNLDLYVSFPIFARTSMVRGCDLISSATSYETWRLSSGKWGYLLSCPTVNRVTVWTRKTWDVTSSRNLKDGKNLGPSTVLIASFLVEIEKMSLLEWGQGVSRNRILTVENELILKLFPAERTRSVTHDLRPRVRWLGIFILMETVACLISETPRLSWFLYF